MGIAVKHKDGKSIDAAALETWIYASLSSSRSEPGRPFTLRETCRSGDVELGQLLGRLLADDRGFGYYSSDASKATSNAGINEARILSRLIFTFLIQLLATNMPLRWCDISGCSSVAEHEYGSCIICSGHHCLKHLASEFHQCPTEVSCIM